MPFKYLIFITKRRWTLLSIAVITPLGFLTKFYNGPASDWVNNSLGGVLYVVFWSLLVFLFFTKVRAWKINQVKSIPV